MTPTTKKLLTIAGVLVVLGLLSMFVLQPVLDGKPEAECAPAGEVTSGFVEGDCNITVESWEEIADWESKAKPYRILGVLLIVAGLGVGIAAIFVGRKKNAPPAPPAG